ncbi:MAG: hypothetical protein SGILL_009204, partial [Bacillariaceae sp.]
NRDLCVYVPREKKRQPKNKKTRRNRNDVRRSNRNVRVPQHRRALSSEEVAHMMNSPSVSPIGGDFANNSAPSSSAFYQSAFLPVTTQQNPSVPGTKNIQPTSFFAEADPHPLRMNVATKNQTSMPQQQQPLQQVQVQQQPQKHPRLPVGRPLECPIKSKPSKSQQWMKDHDTSLWNYVNGLVVDSSNSFNDKNDLAQEASNFSTDEILAEIASTFSGTERSSSIGSNHNSNDGT